MRNDRKQWLGLVLAGAVAAGCTAGAGPRPDTVGEVGTSRMMDSNQNKLFDSLETVLARVSSTEKVPILVLARRHEDLAELEKSTGIEVRHRYNVVPALAARATPEQVQALAKQEAVRQVEHDAEVHIHMDGAARWFGALQARQDFGVNGDRDGAGYSRTDVVTSFLDVQPLTCS